MPLIKTFDIDVKTKLYLWDVEERLTDLQQAVVLTPQQQESLDAIRNEKGKKNFLATRLLLKNIGYTPTALFYDPNGKPFLSDGKQISISHSFNKVAVIISDRKVGVDIEKKREKIVAIAHKFTQWNFRTASFSLESIIQKLTMTWCAKEVGFKIHGNPEFTLNDVKVRDFFPTDSSTEILVGRGKYEVNFIFIEDYVLGYCHSIK